MRSSGRVSEGFSERRAERLEDSVRVEREVSVDVVDECERVLLLVKGRLRQRARRPARLLERRAPRRRLGVNGELFGVEQRDEGPEQSLALLAAACEELEDEARPRERAVLAHAARRALRHERSLQRVGGEESLDGDAGRGDHLLMPFEERAERTLRGVGTPARLEVELKRHQVWDACHRVCEPLLEHRLDEAERLGADARSLAVVHRREHRGLVLLQRAAHDGGELGGGVRGSRLTTHARRPHLGRARVPLLLGAQQLE